MNHPKTLYDKLWQDHLVQENTDGTALIYIDRHLIHEVTSPQAFEGLRLKQRMPWRLDANLAMPDHNVPTTFEDRHGGISDPISRLQVETLDKNCKDYGLVEFTMNHPKQGIVHVVGPETGATLPGMTIVCGDSHTSTHGAFGALAFGIGTSEVEHVLATQCLMLTKSKTMEVRLEGELPHYLSAKDVILAVIGHIGTAGGTGYAIEFTGPVVRNFSMEARMTLCNMAIEAGARSGLIAVDDTTVNYLKGREFAPKGNLWEQAIAHWEQLKSDEGAVYDASVVINVDELSPQVSWGTSPEMVSGVDGVVPDPDSLADEVKKSSFKNALNYMALKPGQGITDIPLDRVFIGSCTNSRIEDLRDAASVVKGYHVSETLQQAMIVPGSGQVKKQAELEGLDEVFKAAGFEWREPGCSMCLAMNADRLLPGEHCASTSNRNFEGRQGYGGRTHLVSPKMAAAAAIKGRFVDIRDWSFK